ncbi:MAG: FixH family protein [Phycisphaerae bacterium]|nr:FixH family protein [Phycisphaerae bacterium]
MNLVRDRWMLVPIVLLGVSVTLAAVTVSFAIAGRPLGVEPDYYEKSLRWDDDRTQAGANDRLGWALSPEISGGQNGFARLAITVKDKHGVLIPVDAMEVEAIPIRNADLRTHVALDRESEGCFAADVPLRFTGQWEFRVRASRGGDTYTDRFRRTLSFASQKGTS